MQRGRLHHVRKGTAVPFLVGSFLPQVGWRVELHFFLQVGLPAINPAKISQSSSPQAFFLFFLIVRRKYDWPYTKQNLREQKKKKCQILRKHT